MGRWRSAPEWRRPQSATTSGSAFSRSPIEWEANDGPPENADNLVTHVGYKTQVTMSFEGLDDGRTLVSIEEHGWKQTPVGLKASYGNCQGWTQMQCALKAWLEHGINLREGMFK